MGLPEQITDQAIKNGEEDLLGHDDFVARLLSIIRNTKTPVNVALFGRWGSGKTGIANLLEDKVGKLDDFERVEFAYFNAFRFARLPLLRRFLVQIAQSLGGQEEAEEYQRRLYERVERVRLTRPLQELKGPMIVWGTWILWALAATIGFFDLVAYLSTDDQLRVLLQAIHVILPLLVPTGLVIGLVAFAARYLTASTTTETPGSEEQFEGLFRELLEKYEIGSGSSERKLVVFVDELDRCSAVEVARTLESLKTFLDQPGCIFVVAADQRVLEHALTRRVRQATPRDLSNPYYSAGSAYLDKIFQHQVTLPPLFPGRLVDFAIRLLGDVGGVWDELESKDEVVSVLLPVHVRSPRRVKVLLNAFAQTFALAIARSKSRSLDENVRDRADEVAKLVGLQTEFPLFAADLPIHRDLPDLVLRCAEADEAEELPEMQGIPAATQERVLGFAQGKLATDEALASDGAANEMLERAQGADLIDYLRQTARVKGPKTDIVHLEGFGLTTGIDEALAIELTDLALKNSAVLVKEVLEALPEDERGKAIGFLRDLVRRSKGNDVNNALHTLLVCWPLAKDPDLGVVRDVLAAVAAYERETGLLEDELPSALDLAIAGHDRSLQASVVERQEATSEPLRSRILDHATSLVDDDTFRLGELLAEEIVESPEKAAKRLTA